MRKIKEAFRRLYEQLRTKMRSDPISNKIHLGYCAMAGYSGGIRSTLGDGHPVDVMNGGHRRAT